MPIFVDSYTMNTTTLSPDLEKGASEDDFFQVDRIKRNGSYGNLPLLGTAEVSLTGGRMGGDVACCRSAGYTHGFSILPEQRIVAEGIQSDALLHHSTIQHVIQGRQLHFGL
jgi:hypothetical protein